MFKHITDIDFKIVSMYIRDYASIYSMRHITKTLKINYSNAFKRIKILVDKGILLQNKVGQVNNISLNIKNIDTIHLISFVEEQESKKLKNSTLQLLAKEAILIDPFACIGIFGSRVSGRATKESDWDVFIICQKEKIKVMNKIMAKFPHAKYIELQVFSLEEFKESLLATEETVIKHIVRNKQIIYNPHPFYNIIYNWEMIKHAPSQ